MIRWLKRVFSVKVVGGSGGYVGVEKMGSALTCNENGSVDLSLRLSVSPIALSLKLSY